MEESLYDRTMREMREERAARRVPSADEAEFLGTALEPIAERIRAEVCDGLRKALGEPVPGPIQGNGVKRSFRVQADSATERARAAVYVDLSGTGPVFDNAAAVHYELDARIHCRRGVGLPFGPMRKIHVTKDMYGDGRPGVGDMDVQSAVINELISRNGTA
jgi:hypothetical protein